MRVIHTADNHAGAKWGGKIDPNTKLPVLGSDFLKSIDQIVDKAIAERVDLVLFSGDLYNTVQPISTVQTEVGKRLMRLSNNGIKTIITVGNHDSSPSPIVSNALDIFSALEIPNLIVTRKPALLMPEDTGLDCVVISLPWIYRSGVVAQLGISMEDATDVLEQKITAIIKDWGERALETGLPVIVSAHASLIGAKVQGGRTTLQWTNTGELLMSPTLLSLDGKATYVALGHIHKRQIVGENPPIVYPGSSTRLDAGEDHSKYFALVEIQEDKQVDIEWVKIKNRSQYDIKVEVDNDTLNPTQVILDKLPEQNKVRGSIVNVRVSYPIEVETMIDREVVASYLGNAVHAHLVWKPERKDRLRLPSDSGQEYSPEDLIKVWLQSAGKADDKIVTNKVLQMAQDIIRGGDIK